MLLLCDMWSNERQVLHNTEIISWNSSKLILYVLFLHPGISHTHMISEIEKGTDYTSHLLLGFICMTISAYLTDKIGVSA